MASINWPPENFSRYRQELLSDSRHTFIAPRPPIAAEPNHREFWTHIPRPFQADQVKSYWNAYAQRLYEFELLHNTNPPAPVDLKPIHIGGCY